MNTLEFFQTILPPTGSYYLATINKPRKGSKSKSFTIHYDYDSLEALAAGVEAHKNNKGVNLFHACGSYKEPFVEANGQKSYRVEDNWAEAKALWIDLDCGQDKFDKGEGYLDQKEACKGILSFCELNDFPAPMIVNSGSGVHCYWPLTKAIPAAKWKVLANTFKQVLAHHGVLADPTVTADFARILRPAGSFNNKTDDGKLVRVMRSVEPIKASLIAERLKDLVAQADIKPTTERSYTSNINDDLMVPVTRIPSYANEIANHCEQFRNFRDTQGAGNYEVFRHIVGSMSLCEEGIELAHEWSGKRLELGHDQCDVDVKFNTWNGGFSLCSTFEKVNPSGCEGCPHKGKINSPVSLGYKEVEAVDIPAAEQTTEEQAETVSEDDPPKLPQGYSYQNGVMIRHMKDKDGTPIAFSFSNTLFYPTKRIRTEDGTYALEMCMHINGTVRVFEIETKSLNTPAKMMDALGQYEITTTNNKDAVMHLSAYMRDSLEKLKRETQEVATLLNFGWSKERDYYLLGTTLYHKDTTVRQVLLGGKAKDEVAKYPKPKGDHKLYGEQLIKLYAEKGYEHYQLTISSLFGSLLIPLHPTETYNGILFNLYGDSGYGKSTVNNAGLLAFGSSKEQTINGSPEGTTTNALYTTLAAVGTQPLLMDEIAKIRQEMLSSLLYNLVVGKDKQRNTYASGKNRKETTDPFGLMLHGTSNQSLLGTLASNNGNTYAEAVRMVELNMNSFAKPHQSTDEVNAAIAVMTENMGAAGAAYIKHLVANISTIEDRIAYWEKRIAVQLSDSDLRFYRGWCACTIAAAELTNVLEITQWDVEALFDFAEKMLLSQVKRVKANNIISPETALSMFLSDLQGHIIVTSEYRDSRHQSGLQTSQANVIGEAKARLITGVAGPKQMDNYHGRLYFKKNALKTWCNTNNRKLDPEAVLKYIEDNGLRISIGTAQDQFTIGRGTSATTGNAPCYCIDYNKYQELTGVVDDYKGLQAVA